MYLKVNPLIRCGAKAGAKDTLILPGAKAGLVPVSLIQDQFGR